MQNDDETGNGNHSYIDGNKFKRQCACLKCNALFQKWVDMNGKNGAKTCKAITYNVIPMEDIKWSPFSNK